MTEVPANAPGCFGSAIAYQADHFFCKACTFNAGCEPMHAVNLAILRERLGVGTVTQKPRKPAMPSSTPHDPAIPQKVKELVDRLDRMNLRVTEKLAAGVNPFVNMKAGFLQYACHLLLNLNRPITRDLLSVAFERKFSWQEDTAKAHARMVFYAFKHIGAVDEVEGAIKIRGPM